MTVKKINEWFARIGKFQVAHRFAFIILMILISSVGLAGLSKLVLRNNEENWSNMTDVQKEHKVLFEEMFGNQDIVAVFVEAPNVFEPEVIDAIERLCVRLENEVPFASSVMSLTRVLIPTGEGIALQAFNPFAEGIPGSGKKISEMSESEKALLEQKKSLIMNRTSLVNNLVSDDATETWVVLSLEPFTDKELSSVGAAAIKIVESEEFQSDLYTFKGSGNPYTVTEQQKFIARETSIRILAGFIVMIVCLIIFVRSLRGVVVPVLVTLGGIGSVLGFSSWFGISAELNLMTVPILLGMALSVCYAVHYVNGFKYEFRRSGKRKEAVVDAIESTGWPIFFTVITTMASFVSFIGVGIGALKWVGAISSLIVFTVYLYVIILLPILYSFGKDSFSETDLEIALEAKRQKAFRKIDAMYARVGESVLKHRVLIIVLSVIIFAFSFVGLSRITINMDYVSMMGNKVPFVKRIISIMNAKLGTQHSYDVMIEYNEADVFKNPTILKSLEECSAELAKLRLTKISGNKPRVNSLANIVKELNSTFNGSNLDYYTIPEDEEYLSYLFYMYEYSGGEELFDWVNDDYSVARIHVEMQEYNAVEVDADITDAERLAKKYFPGAKTSCIGEVIDFASMNHTLVTGELKSLGGAFLIILIILMIAFMSVRVGLIGMIPNISPVMLVGGLMGFLKFPLDMLTMTIMPMILGIAVDDTIHFANHMKYEYELTHNYHDAIINTFVKVGRSMIAATIILCAMFIVYVFSPITMMFRIGLLSAIGLFAALVADYTLTPALLYITKPFGKSK